MPNKKFEDAADKTEKYSLMIRQFASFVADVEKATLFAKDEKDALLGLGLFSHGISHHIIKGLRSLQRKEE